MRFNFNFIKHRKKFFIATIILMVIGFVSLFVNGLNLGLDFVSGTRVEIHNDEKMTEEEISKLFEEISLEPETILFSGENNEIGSVNFNVLLDEQEVSKVRDKISEVYGVDPNINTVSPQVGRELAKNAFVGLLLASVGIMVYLAFRFEWLKGVSTLIALLHDAIFVVLFFSIFQFEIDITFIAAVLTIVGYSVNDKIVTFDRIRENMQDKEVKTYEELSEIVNLSLNQTLTRSINTILTILFTAVALLILGSDAIFDFSIALVVGLIAGAYSSLFIASQIWLNIKWKQIEYRKLNPKEDDDIENDLDWI